MKEKINNDNKKKEDLRVVPLCFARDLSLSLTAITQEFTNKANCVFGFGVCVCF